MSLQIRRGTEGQRTAVTFDLGEIVYTTDSKKLYIGDGGTPGGINILSTAAGTGLTWNSTTNTLNFSGDLSGYTTDNVAEGTVNQYFTRNRAQDAAAAIFTAVGSPTVTGIVTSTTAPHTVTVNSNSGLVALEPFVVTGTGGNGLSTGTYYVINPSAGADQITLASSLANAQAGTAITVTTGGLSTTNFSAGGGGDSNITFTYNSTSKTMTATVSSLAAGIHSVNEDTSPLLGGNLGLNNHNITGTGNIGITGNISSSGTITATTGLGANLPLNSYNITGTGNIGITGNISSSGTITATTGLGADLPLNSYNITGTGNIGITGTVTATSISATSFGAITIPDGILTSTQKTNGQPLAKFYGEVYPVDSWISLNMSRGTTISPSAVQAGDTMSGIIVYGHDGFDYSQAVAIGAQVDPAGTVATGAVPGSFVVLTTKTGGGRNQLSFNSTGTLSAPVIQTGTYTTIPDTRPATPALGMIIFETTTNTFQGWNGTSWTTLG